MNGSRVREIHRTLSVHHRHVPEQTDEWAYLFTDLWMMYFLNEQGDVFQQSFLYDCALEPSSIRSSTAILRLAAKRTGLSELSELIPKPKPNSRECPSRKGNFFINTKKGELLCFLCGGQGWVTPDMIDAAINSGYTSEYWHKHPLEHSG